MEGGNSNSSTSLITGCYALVVIIIVSKQYLALIWGGAFSHLEIIN